jgi:hypothetical protein
MRCWRGGIQRFGRRLFEGRAKADEFGRALNADDNFLVADLVEPTVMILPRWSAALHTDP